MQGWLNIHKPCGITSFDVIFALRKALNIRKIGHAGTLDKEANGVLPVAVGNATRLIEYAMLSDKEYIFTMQFGTKTSTGDKEGSVLMHSEYTPTSSDLEYILPSFVGGLMQKPHKFSAIKVNGRRAYDLARSGVEFDLEPRKIEISSLKLIEFDQDKREATIKAKCSKGTYIRSLAEDIADSLHSVCFVRKLIRIRVGSFYIDDAVDHGNVTIDHLQPITALLDDISVVNISEESALKIKNGQLVHISNYSQELKSDCVFVKFNEELVAVGLLIKKDSGETFFKPKKVFKNHK